MLVFTAALTRPRACTTVYVQARGPRQDEIASGAAGDVGNSTNNRKCRYGGGGTVWWRGDCYYRATIIAPPR